MEPFGGCVSSRDEQGSGGSGSLRRREEISSSRCRPIAELECVTECSDPAVVEVGTAAGKRNLAGRCILSERNLADRIGFHGAAKLWDDRNAQSGRNHGQHRLDRFQFEFGLHRRCYFSHPRRCHPAAGQRCIELKPVVAFDQAGDGSAVGLGRSHKDERLPRQVLPVEPAGPAGRCCQANAKRSPQSWRKLLSGMMFREADLV